MKLRKVTSLLDAVQVSELAERCWRPHYTPIIGKEQVDYMLKKFQSAPAIHEQIEHGRDYQVIEENDETLGYIATDLDEMIFLSKLYILPDQKGRGAGRWAVNQVAQAHPDLPIHLTVNKHNHDAIAFYERLGFTKNGPIVADIGNGYVMDDWIMRRPSVNTLWK